MAIPRLMACFVLSFSFESISTNNPRIEWKKIKNGIPSYVYFQNRIAGDLEHRAQLREPANIMIFNATRSDTAEYRCEVAAIDDQRDFDEILIMKPVVPRCSVPEAVTVGTSTELRCLENEGFPAPQYRWFHNSEELPQESKNSPKLVNASYSINPDTGGLKFRRVKKEDAGEYYCQAKNDAGQAQCPSQMMEVSTTGQHRTRVLNTPMQMRDIFATSPHSSFDSGDGGRDETKARAKNCYG
ncbi:Junctional adhesion molecule C [Liparis tanakae]|uniref:Junctional adhesion molecule C n=1 Tax=Liparis tanakae TaxID=230148 RepID=A0A4Z2I5J4_9TELE|nr:Junctional adhesion molecule C [Liparis tanakae]